MNIRVYIYLMYLLSLRETKYKSIYLPAIVKRNQDSFPWDELPVPLYGTCLRHIFFLSEAIHYSSLRHVFMFKTWQVWLTFCPHAAGISISASISNVIVKFMRLADTFVVWSVFYCSSHHILTNPKSNFDVQHVCDELMPLINWHLVQMCAITCC